MSRVPRSVAPGPARTLPRVLTWVPRGCSLPASEWSARHGFVVALLVAHVPALLLFALLAPGHAPLELVAAPAVPALAAAVAAIPRLGRLARATTASVGLVACSAVTVHLAHGAIEAHFHFFVMIPVIALYEHWLPFGLSVAFVLCEHGVLGTLRPEDVYDHGHQVAHPWTFAGVHAGAFAAACVGSLANWRLHEQSRARQDDLSAILRERTRFDRLTGLRNRDWLLDEAAAELGQVDLGRSAVAVLVLDVNRFSEINDTLGHALGDRLLLEFAQRLVGGLSTHEYAVRLGGDAFAVLLAGERAFWAREAAERLCREITSERVSLGGVDLDVEVTVGVAVRGAADAVQGAEAEVGAEGLLEGSALRDLVADLVRRADVALNAGKRAGAAVTCYDPDTDRHTVDRLGLLTDLREALFSDELALAYQPKIRLDDGALVGVEALLRWTHPVRGPVPPMDFVPLAEATSLVVPLTHRVLTLALIQTAWWRRSGLETRISVNVPPRCLAEEDFVRVVLAALAATDVPPRLLCLELTETSLMDDPERTLAVMGELRDAGVGLSLDDFGTGYSSLSYLRRVPADELKIDKAFVRGLLEHPQDAILVETTVALAHRLGMSVVAEGVEDAETAQALERLGCDHAQGYLYARPLPPAELLDWAAGRRHGSDLTRG